MPIEQGDAKKKKLFKKVKENERNERYKGVKIHSTKWLQVITNSTNKYMSAQIKFQTNHFTLIDD